MKLPRSIWLLLPISLLSAPAAAAEPEWGDLKMRFVVEGKAPALRPLEVTKDKAICGEKVPNEEFVVDKNGHIQNIVVSLVPDKGQKLAIHPDYDKPGVKDKEVSVAMKDCRFQPHVVAVRVGQTLVLEWEDKIGHNANIPTILRLHPRIPTRGPQKELIDKAAAKPLELSCSIHPWMFGWVAVHDHPYVAVSDAEGKVELKNVPVGKHVFQFWQESLKEVVASSGKFKLSQSRMTINVKSGMNDLGEWNVRPPKE